MCRALLMCHLLRPLQPETFFSDIKGPISRDGRVASNGRRSQRDRLGVNLNRLVFSSGRSLEGSLLESETSSDFRFFLSPLGYEKYFLQTGLHGCTGNT
ncbi:hypothetical protein CDAR_125341 [Caerostris darwini]|uniref:Uncharacterized protein n=1 Tax=Caerostris darwini TaxID=1538125 RepID=A0AAV4Q5Z8_9ARAC|nr:hypothetical protein CDAR_125341 [Caerostris darwini]